MSQTKVYLSRFRSLVTDSRDLGILVIVVAATASFVLPGYKLVILLVFSVVVYALALLFVFLTSRARAGVAQAIVTGTLAISAPLIAGGATGGFNGVTLVAEFPYIQPAPPDPRIIAVGVMLLVFGVLSPVWLGVGASSVPLWRGAISLVLGLVAGIAVIIAFPAVGSSAAWPVVVSRLIVSIENPEFRAINLPAGPARLLEAYDISFEYEFEYIDDRDVEFFSGFASPWGRVEVFEATSSTEQMSRSSGRLFHRINVPAQAIGSQGSHVVRGRVFDLVDGLRQSGMHMDPRQGWHEEYWSKNINVGESVQFLVFKYPNAAFTEPIRVERKGKMADTYVLTGSEWSHSVDQGVARIEIPDPELDHTYRIFVGIRPL